MSDESTGGTCGYVADEETYADWGGQPAVWPTVLDQLGVDGETWHCPHDALADGEYCPFHTDPDDLPAEVDEKKRFRDALAASTDPDSDRNSGATDSDPGGTGTADEQYRKRQFVGASLGSLDLGSVEVRPAEELPLTLIGASVDGPVRIDGTVECLVVGDRMTVEGDVDLAGASFGADVTLRWTDVDGRITFDGVTVDGGVDVGGATVSEDIQFHDADVDGVANVAGCDTGGVVNFLQATVGGELNCEGATPDGPLTLSQATVREDLVLDECHVETLFCREVTVDGDASAVGATVDGGVELQRATVRGRLRFRDAAVESDLDLGGSHVEDGIQFQDATVAGDLDATEATIDGGLYGDGATVDGSISLEFGTVSGGVGLSHVDVGGDLLVPKTTVSGGLDGRGMQVDGDATFRMTTITGDSLLHPTSDRRTRFGGAFEFVDATFENEADFGAREIDGERRAVVFETPPAFAESDLAGADFTGTDLSHAQFHDANLTGVIFTDATLHYATLEQARLSRATLFGADLRGARLSGALFGDARIDEATRFLGVPGDDASDYAPAGLFETPSVVYDEHYTGRTDADLAPDGGLPPADMNKAKSVYRAIEELARDNARPRLQSQTFVKRQDTQRSQYSTAAATLDTAGERLVAHARWLRASVARWTLLYGESPWRVIGLSLLVVGLFSLVYPFGLIRSPETGVLTWSAIADDPTLYVESLYYSTLKYVGMAFNVYTPANAAGELVTVLEGGMGAVFIALLVFVLGRRAAR